MNEKSILLIQNLNKSFGHNTVLKDFNLQLYPQQNIVVLGKSGSGKSVLIKCIIGLLKPDAGEIFLFNQNIKKLSSKALDKIRIRVGFLFQSNALYDSMTVRENLEFPLRRHWIKFSQNEVAEKINQALTDVGLAFTLNMMPEELSGGMRKRIALARALIMEPEIILYDEPTTGLDPITSKEIIKLINTIKVKYGTAALIISHDMNCVKLTSDLVAVLHEGRCYALGTYQALRESQDNIVKDFFQ